MLTEGCEDLCRGVVHLGIGNGALELQTLTSGSIQTVRLVASSKDNSAVRGSRKSTAVVLLQRAEQMQCHAKQVDNRSPLSLERSDAVFVRNHCGIPSMRDLHLVISAHHRICRNKAEHRYCLIMGTGLDVKLVRRMVYSFAKQRPPGCCWKRSTRVYVRGVHTPLRWMCCWKSIHGKRGGRVRVE